jgi:hypothetical protein
MAKKKTKLIQEDLFTNPKTELDVVWEAITSLKESHNSVRKRLFQELEELRTSLIEAKAQNAHLMAVINKNNQYDIFAEMLEAQ